MIIPSFSISTLSNLSIVTVITNVLNIGVNLAFNIDQNLKKIPQEKDPDSGAPIRQNKLLLKLKSFNYYSWMKWHIRIFVAILLCFLAIEIIQNFVPEISTQYKVDIGKGFIIKIIRDGNILVACTDPVNKLYDIPKSIIMALVGIVSWVNIFLITVSYFIIIKISGKYIQLLKHEDNDKNQNTTNK